MEVADQCSLGDDGHYVAIVFAPLGLSLVLLHGLLSGEAFPSLDRHIDVLRLPFQRIADPTKLFRRDQLGAAAQEGLIADVPNLGVVLVPPPTRG